MLDRHGTITGYNKGCRCDACSECRKDEYRRRAEELRRNPADPRHGTTTGSSEGCSCKGCSYAYKVWAAARLAGGKVTHGTTTGYRMGCRCEECREAKLDANSSSLAFTSDTGSASMAELRIFAQGLGMPVPRPGPRRDALVKRYNRLHPERPYSEPVL